MNKNIFKSLVLLCLTFFSLSVKAQDAAPDEDTGLYTTCTAAGANETRTSDDLPNPVNVGTIDDRSCYANYKEVDLYGKTWGVYNITDGSNNQDAANTLEPRIERSLSRSTTVGLGSYARFTGIVRILETGDTSGTNRDGTYLIQAKGKHSGEGGSNDPAICLYLAKPVYGTGINAGKQVAFDIYAERILFRGGEGSGRETVFLKRVNKNEEISFELEVGFRKDPNDATKKVHYCDAVIGGDSFKFNIPEPERGQESGIRYGAYRVKGGRAQIRWANTTYEKVEKTDIDSGNIGSDGKVYSLKNVATGKFLTDSGASALPVTMSDSDEAQNTHWTFVETGAFFNIESETFGIIRGPGGSFAAGPYVVVSTSKAAPAEDVDKIWKVHYNESDDTYRYESGNSGRFLYHEENGTVTHVIVDETDARSKWKATAISQSLSTFNEELQTPSVNIYPNPAHDSFTIDFKNSKTAKIKIMNLLGKVVYTSTSSKSSIKLSKSDGFSSGLYIIQVIDKSGIVSNKKLVIN